MSKLLSVLAFAGDKSSAAQAAGADVAMAVARSMLHGDRSFFADTIRELTGKKTRTARAALETLGRCDAMVGAMRSGDTLAPVSGAAPWHAAFILPTLPEGLTLDVIVAKGAKDKATVHALAPWARDVGAAWLTATQAHADAAGAAATAARKATIEAKAVEAKATDDVQAPTTGEVVPVGQIDGVVNVDAVHADALRDAEQAIADAQARADKAEKRANAAEQGLTVATQTAVEAQQAAAAANFRAQQAETRAAEAEAMLASMQASNGNSMGAIALALTGAARSAKRANSKRTTVNA